MANSTKNYVIVKYWRGTTQLEGRATTYAGALRIAGRNQNAYGPTYYSAAGEKLYDDGHGLVEESEADRWGTNPNTQLTYYA